MLLSVNPFKEINGLYSEAHIAQYRGRYIYGQMHTQRDGSIKLQPSPRVAPLISILSLTVLLRCVAVPSSLSENPPHVFGLAEDTYRALCTEGEDQCVIISVSVRARNLHTALDDGVQQSSSL